MRVILALPMATLVGLLGRSVQTHAAAEAEGLGMNHQEMAQAIVRALGFQSELPATATLEDYVSYLEANNIAPLRGWIPQADATIDDLAVVTVLAMGLAEEVENTDDAESYKAVLDERQVSMARVMFHRCNITVRAAVRELGLTSLRRNLVRRHPLFASAPVAQDGFDGKLSLAWKILHDDPSHYSLDKTPGTLTITTQEGAFTRDKNDYENVFLIDCPPEAGDDFEVTICISSFKPVVGWNQAGLIFWNDEDNYLKWDYEASMTRVPLFTVGRETGGSFVASSLRAPVGIDKAWLRVKKRENHYDFLLSTDGTAWYLQRRLEWGDGSVKRIGLFAMNDSPSAAPEVDASFDFFEVRALPVAP